MSFSKKTVIFSLMFFLPVIFLFQNCTELTKSSDEPSTQDFLAGSGTNLNLNDGDSVSYIEGKLLVPSEKSVTIRFDHEKVLAVTEVHYSGLSEKANDLPKTYCQYSILPHCRHLSDIECLGETCNLSRPIKCSEQKKLSQEEANSMLRLFSDIRIEERHRLSGESMRSDCDDPHIYFSKFSETPEIISLAPRECVPENSLYSEHSDTLKAEFKSYFAFLESQGSDCNLFHRYSFSTTEFEYKAYSGFTIPENSYFYEVKYKGQRAELRYKKAGQQDQNSYCADDVPVNVSEVEAFFPNTGLKYEIFSDLFAIADAPAAQVTYKDEAYGQKGEVQFFLNKISAQANSGGGAFLNKDHERLMKDAIDAIVARAENLKLNKSCGN